MAHPNRNWQLLALTGALAAAGGLFYTLRTAFVSATSGEMFCGVNLVTPQDKNSLLGTIPESVAIHDQLKNVYRKASDHIANGKIVTIEKLESQTANQAGEEPKPGEPYLQMDCYRLTAE